MGTVYEAWQERPRRRVALKLMRPGLTTPALLRRFHLEADILGLLEHPAIARVYEAGTASLGGMEQPYLTMELIEGLPLTTYVEREALSLRDRVSLLIAIADGVHFAHQKGVIHRDLKPANILVDPAGQPKILDFGIARMVTADPQATLPPTGDGRPVGTLATMAPEQARGDTKAIDTQSDVYALGVIAYRILTGQYPFALHELPTHEAIRILLETEPARPGDVNPALRGDLDVIMRKAMAKDKTQRYASAAALADDWRHYLRNEPIAARPPSAWYQARTFARRNKIWVGASAAVLLALITGALLATVGLIRARQAEQQARANLRQALDTVDQFTAFVAEGQLAGIAEAAPAREQLLRDAVFFYEQLLTANPGDARLQDELSWALARLAQANKSAGDFDNARSALEKRIAHLIDLRRRETENRTHLRNLARARFELTHVLDKANDQAAARAVFSEAYTLYGELLAIDPDDRDLRMEMAYLLGN